MNIKSIKRIIKKNHFVASLYDCLFGNRKRKKILEYRRELFESNSGVKIVEYIGDVLEGNEFVAFPDFGTLLGLVRDNRLLLWDIDIDFGIFIEDEEDWVKLKSTLSDNGFILSHQFKINNHITEQTYVYKNMSIDFFKHENVDGYNRCYIYSSLCSDGDNRYYVNESRTVLLKEFQRKQFGEVIIKVPNNSEEYLACVYGSSWNIPNPGWESGSGPSIRLLEGQYGTKEIIS